MDNPNIEPVKHKRRVRYKGTHPRRFEEKYKELNPEKYAVDVEKVIASGKTPAGTHRSICVNEVLDILKPMPGQIGVDATLGFGGHAKELLKKILPGGKLFALDVDPIEITKTEQRLRAMGFSDKELIVKRSNFAGIHKLLSEVPGGFDFILVDLGVSSMQLDNPQRGFTFKHEGLLDLRFNPQRGQPAATEIKKLSEKELRDLFINNADEPRATSIAREIFKNRNNINTTKDLVDAIVCAFGAKTRQECGTEGTDSIRRVFQALRIYVNDEFGALEQFLRNLPVCLKSQGRVAILTFHSGEDRRVMRSFMQGLNVGVYEEISKEEIRPTAQEQGSNPRSKSAVLRWAIKK